MTGHWMLSGPATALGPPASRLAGHEHGGPWISARATAARPPAPGSMRRLAAAFGSLPTYVICAANRAKGVARKSFLYP